MANLTVLEKLNIGAVSESLSLIDITKSGLYGGGVDLDLPNKIYCIRKSIQWLYDLDNTDATLFDTTNYLIALCGKYYLEANNIIAGGGGSPVVPVVPTGMETFLEFEVNDSSPIPTDGDTYIFNTAPYDWRGLEVQFNRGNQPQGRLNFGSTYYSWDKINGTFQIFGAAIAGEDLMIYVTP